jgi:hypothetical protein
MVDVRVGVLVGVDVDVAGHRHAAGTSYPA